MSNFTDFNALAEEADVALRYVATPEEAAGADVMILPGSKTTLSDLAYLREKGFDRLLQDHVQGGRELVGICGGYQMLGQWIADPDGVETGGQDAGLGMLPVTTRLARDKITEQVEARALHIEGAAALAVRGYLIHMGRTDRAGLRPCFQLLRTSGEMNPDATEHARDEDCLDGAVRHDGLVWGTYVHGLFDQPDFRRAWLNRLRGRKGLPAVPFEASHRVNETRLKAMDRWADHVDQHLDLAPVLAWLR